MSAVIKSIAVEDSTFFIPSQLTVGNRKVLSNSEKFMEEDLRKSGLTPQDIGAAVADFVLAADVSASYRIPYFDLDGKRIANERGHFSMWNSRRTPSATHKHDRDFKKYKRPGREDCPEHYFYPYMHPSLWESNTDVLHICEGEKKAAAVLLKTGQAAIGIPGKDVREDTTVEVVLHAIEKLKPKEIWLWPDADVVRYDVRRSYGMLQSYLQKGTDCPIKLMQPGWDMKKHKGIDDALGAGVPWEQIISAGPSVERPVWDAKSLANLYGLQTIETKNSIKLRVNEYNFEKILNIEEEWGEWKLNIDTRQMTCDDVEIVYKIDSSKICIRIQSQFAMPEATVDRLWNVVTSLCEQHSYSPWNDYLNSLKWDGTPRIAHMLTKACGAEDTEFVREASEKFMCSAVARSLNPGCKVDWMLILHGPQGTGKSSLPEALIGPEWGHLTRFVNSKMDKDQQLQLSRSVIANFDEMAVFFTRQEETEQIKELVTKTVDSYRPPYGRANEDIPRRCIMFGSTNKPNLIKYDDSGFRRWVVISVEGAVQTKFGIQFDWEWLETWREQLWAEAAARWRSVDVSQVRGAAAHAEQYVQENHLEGAIVNAILGMFKPGELKVGEPIYYESLYTVMNAPRTDRTSKDIGRFFKQYKCEHHRGRKGRGYLVSKWLFDFLGL